MSCARSYAFGRSLIQDLGYYPFGSHFFSNLLHYSRSGDVIVRLLGDARDAEEYAFALGALAQLGAGRLTLRNTNFDTGRPAAHGEYPLADDTYAELVLRLEEAKFSTVSPDLARNILAFCGDSSTPAADSRRERKDWRRIQAALSLLRSR